VTDAATLFDSVASRLLDERTASGHWEGELSTSALSTATASFALYAVDRARGDERHRDLVEGGLDWLVRHVNTDGGWGDTTRSLSNISTTTLCFSALSAAAPWRERYSATIAGAREWIVARAGSVEAAPLAAAITDVYGEDRTFSVPILTMAALAGQLGDEPECWRHVRQLPFELAALPRRSFRLLGLPVVSYALPALIAIGHVRDRRRPGNPFAHALRAVTRSRALRVLDSIQPTNGGFLEATPLTSFVTMSLAGAGDADHAVTQRAVGFLENAARDDGSWPIDTNLATWVTTLSINALAASGRLEGLLSGAERLRLRDWLLAQQYRDVHSYTDAPPGAWAWTDLPGGVPDADDTAGALLALRHLEPPEEATRQAAAFGVRWLLDLQNRDGGVPTFCRGWGKLPFDRSGADLTAHALRAFVAWRDHLPSRTRRTGLARKVDRAIEAGVSFLRATQRDDGAWQPLWFGNQHADGNLNLTYGTAKVLVGLDAVGSRGRVDDLRARGTAWLVAAQNDVGGWGGVRGVESSLEETALAVEALAAAGPEAPGDARQATARGVDWLARAIEQGCVERPTPIGFYFANLWYFERLYPLIFATDALGRVARRSG